MGRLRRQIGRAGWQLFGMLAQVKPVGEVVLAVEAKAADALRANLQQQHASNRQKAEAQLSPAAHIIRGADPHSGRSWKRSTNPRSPLFANREWLT